MTDLVRRLRSVVSELLPLPGGGETTIRHQRLLEVGREDLSLARLAEAHWDARAILAEAGHQADPTAIYGVWASEISGQALEMSEKSSSLVIRGQKRFCSGVGIIDRALLTTADGCLVDIDLREQERALHFDDSAWTTSAFSETKTSTTTFSDFEIEKTSVVGREDWYGSRPGFWHGACGPAACWAGGAIGLFDFALEQRRDDPHTLAHLGAIGASVWALRSLLDTAGREIDDDPFDSKSARMRALTVRHLVEQSCTEVLRRLARAYGPHPLAMGGDVSRRYIELDLYVRQSHAERDLETLGKDLRGDTLSSKRFLR